MTAYALSGAITPATVWLNGQIVTGRTLTLKKGRNPIVLEYDKPGRTYFVVTTDALAQPPPSERELVDGQPKFKSSPLAMSWWENSDILPFDVRAADPRPIGWYRFTSPPGLKTMTLPARGKAQAWINGKEIKVNEGKVVVPEPSPQPVQVLFRIEQERGCYAGAALTAPLRMECVPGAIALGDWSKLEGLLAYSGGAWYRKTVNIPASRKVILDLGGVSASARVRVNGRSAGVRVSAPWQFDVTALVKAGDNRIEVLVHNALANHYTTVPTSYRGETTSGLLGPVKIHRELP
jgi:hypothetical protein